MERFGLAVSNEQSATVTKLTSLFFLYGRRMTMLCGNCKTEVTPIVVESGVLVESCKCPRCGHLQLEETKLYAGINLAKQIMKALGWE